jgi:hypothetical protein
MGEVSEVDFRSRQAKTHRLGSAEIIEPVSQIDDFRYCRPSGDGEIDVPHAEVTEDEVPSTRPLREEIQIIMDIIKDYEERIREIDSQERQAFITPEKAAELRWNCVGERGRTMEEHGITRRRYLVVHNALRLGLREIIN